MFSFRSLNREQKEDVLTGVIMLLFGIGMLVQTFFFTSTGKMGDPGPALLPRIIGILIISLSALLLFNTARAILKTGKSAVAEPEARQSNVDKRAIILTFALFLYYFFALHPLGYILCSIIYVFLQMLVLSGKPSIKQLILFAGLSVGVPVLVYYIFVNLFYLFLPRGIFW